MEESIGACPRKEQHLAVTLFWIFIINRGKYRIYFVISLHLYLTIVNHTKYISLKTHLHKINYTRDIGTFYQIPRPIHSGRMEFIHNRNKINSAQGYFLLFIFLFSTLIDIRPCLDTQLHSEAPADICIKNWVLKISG